MKASDIVNYRKSLLMALMICFGVVAQAQAQVSIGKLISIEHPWARATPSGARTGAAYLMIVNHGSTVDRLMQASTPLAEQVQFHQEIDDNGVMQMRELPTVNIDPGASVTFKPSAMHIMIIGLKQQLKEGQTLPLTLQFEKAGKIDLQVPIAKVGAMGDHDVGGM
jgi:copper(I)-binding protein